MGILVKSWMAIGQNHDMELCQAYKKGTEITDLYNEVFLHIL